jgi:tetratricopeptide (TPR) repeat protein
VRCEAARVLAPSPKESLTKAQKEAFEAALGEYVEAQEAVGDRPGGQMALALLYGDLGDAERAEKHYRKATEIAPRHVPSRVNLAEFLQQSGRGDEALPLLEEAVAANPENSIAHESLGRYHIRQRRYDEGIKHIRLAAELDRDRAPVQYFYGVALNSLGKFEEALPFLQRANGLDPMNREYLVGLATICRDAGQFDLAIRSAEALVALEPADEGAAQLLRQLQAMKAAAAP